jgi:hypothetical protein
MWQRASCLLVWRRLVAGIAYLMILRRCCIKSHIFAIIHRRAHLEIFTRVLVDWGDVRGTAHVLAAALRSIVKGMVFWSVELAELADGPAGRGEVVRGGCWYAWIFSVTRSDIRNWGEDAKTWRCRCFSDSLLAYRLEIPPAKNRALYKYRGINSCLHIV